MLKRHSNAGMNPRMAAIMCVFQVAWVYYGLFIVFIASRPVVVWNVIAIVTKALTVGAYVYFVRQERARRTRNRVNAHLGAESRAERADLSGFEPARSGVRFTPGALRDDVLQSSEALPHP
jgi:hypothetical protein